MSRGLQLGPELESSVVMRSGDNNPSWGGGIATILWW